MPLEIINCEQNSPEWYEARRGLPTSSEFATIMAKGKDGGASKTRAAYLRRLAGEIITGDLAETYRNAAMDRGHVMEGEAREFYAMVTDTAPELVGFIRNGNKGGSPDALIGSDGLLEIKTAAPHVLIEYLERDQFPPEHVAQCMGNLWVSERDWIDIIVFWPKMPPLIKRARRDPAKIAQIASAVDQFNDDLAALVERVRRYGERAAA